MPERIPMSETTPIEQVRRMGIGAAMTLKAAQEARRHGYHIAILTASSLGVGIYRRLGFRQYCTFSTYSSIKRDMVPRSDNPLRLS